MAKSGSEKMTSKLRREVIIDFLAGHLAWLEKQCLEYSALAATGDRWAGGQYRYFKEYRKNVRHLMSLARATKHPKPPTV